MPIEGQRNLIHTYRQEILDGTIPCATDMERLVTLRAIDDLWADYLARVADFRSGVHWLSWGRRDPHYEYLQKVHEWFSEMQAALPEEIERRLAEAKAGIGRDPGDRGTVWTYITTDEPFGNFTERLVRGLARKFRRG